MISFFINSNFLPLPWLLRKSCYYHLDAQAPLCGTIQNRASKEMLYCASSTGSDFERRERDLRKARDIIQGILANANQEVAL